MIPRPGSYSMFASQLVMVFLPPNAVASIRTHISKEALIRDLCKDALQTELLLPQHLLFSNVENLNL